MNHLTPLVTRVRTLTGFHRNEASLAFDASCRAIVEELLEGSSVTIRGLGKLVWKIAAPRTIPQRNYPNGAIAPAQHLPERPILKFVMAPSVRGNFKSVSPKKIIKNQSWSKQRKKNEAT